MFGWKKIVGFYCLAFLFTWKIQNTMQFSKRYIQILKPKRNDWRGIFIEHKTGILMFRSGFCTIHAVYHSLRYDNASIPPWFDFLVSKIWRIEVSTPCSICLTSRLICLHIFRRFPHCYSIGWFCISCQAILSIVIMSRCGKFYSKFETSSHS